MQGSAENDSAQSRLSRPVRCAGQRAHTASGPSEPHPGAPARTRRAPQSNPTAREEGVTVGSLTRGRGSEATPLRLSDLRSIGLLAADPSLGDALDPKRFEAARKQIVTTSAVLGESIEPAGSVSSEPDPDTTLLVVAGLLVRRIVIDERPRSELLGPGDVIRPWDRQTIRGLPAQPSMLWRVVRPTRVAVLNERLIDSAGPWPEVLGEVVARAVRRAHSLAVLLAASALPRVEHRLSVLFWHLADRWGRVTPEGVRLDLPLTHELLAELVGAQRPTVTAALTHLSEARSILRGSDGSWLLGLLADRELGARAHVAPFAS